MAEVVVAHRTSVAEAGAVVRRISAAEAVVAVLRISPHRRSVRRHM